MPLSEPLVWIDLEMTGLDPDRDHIVEIAVILTDGRLRELIEGPSLVLATPAEALEAMVPVVRDMHESSGLLARIAEAETTVDQAETAVVAFLRQHLHPDDVPVLAGNSVHTDRAFLRRHMPTIDGLLHYRHVDVSTLKELARRWMPGVVEAAPAKGGSHRALTDIRESITELRHYRARLFRDEAQEPQ